MNISTILFKLFLLFCVFVLPLQQQRLLSCELMGYSFNQPVAAKSIFSTFRLRDKKNQDGWGVAYYPDSSVQLYKEPVRATKSDLANFLERYDKFSAPTLIAHVRNGSVGSRAYRNTHPYSMSLFGQPYSLAHNGNLFDFKEKLPLGTYKPAGDTDSEHLFSFLLDRINSRGVREWKQEDFLWLQKTLHRINATGPMNLVFSDGKHLFAYRDKNDYTALHYVKQSHQDKKVALRDKNKTINLQTEYPKNTKGYVVATRPLTNEKWQLILPGQLLVFSKGEKIFEGKAMKKWYFAQ